MCNCLQMFPYVFSQQTHILQLRTCKKPRKIPITLCNVKVKQMQPKARQKLLLFQHSKVYSFGHCTVPHLLLASH